MAENLATQLNCSLLGGHSGTAPYRRLKADGGPTSDCGTGLPCRSGGASAGSVVSSTPRNLETASGRLDSIASSEGPSGLYDTDEHVIRVSLLARDSLFDEPPRAAQRYQLSQSPEVTIKENR